MVEVYKFGGTCNNSVEKLDRVSEIIAEADQPVIATLSAAAGVTNYITQVLNSQLNEVIIDKVIKHLSEIHQNLLPNNANTPPEITSNLKRLERLLYGIHYTEELTERTRDLVLSFGELLIVPIIREYLRIRGLEVKIMYPENFIITDGEHGSALVYLDKTENRIQEIVLPELIIYDVIVVPGFYGVSEDDKITLLGRSGTDYTATVVAHGLNATSVTIWKDVLGFMSADPKLVENAHTIPALSYAEAAELAYFGATLLHPRAASPARIKGIPIKIRHIDQPNAITVIHKDNQKSDDVIKSVSHMSNLAVVKVFASVGGNTRGVLTKISEKIAEAGGNTISIATSQTCIAFLMKEMEALATIDYIKSLGPGIVDNVEIVDGISLICIVGEGLGSTPGIASQAFDAVARQNINVDLISAGASSTAYHFTVRENDLKDALVAVHSHFFED